ncbi:MAG: formate/nitrite transporter family protein [Anaerolineae bacterium]|jgi:formate/nitrite transporter|nr:formate/nitrite transporter family protein [Anaerolineae bacterium]MDH7474507.1 formate/nitrite transporter family protein [Anaerolineae bacterium]
MTVGFKKPSEITEAACTIGKTKAEESILRLLVLGFLAGAYIAFGGTVAIATGKGITAEGFGGLSKLIFAGTFPVGLMLVVIAGSELFTGNCSMLPASCLSGRAKWAGLLKNWVFVYIGNFIGSLFVAYCLGYLSNLFGKDPYLSGVQGIATSKVALSFWQVFWRGVGCNWLVCLAVWLAVSANDIAGKVWGIWFPIMAFVAIGFEHSVANMFFIPLGIFYGAPVTWGQFLLNNLLPATLGNIVGGGFFVGTIYWWLYGRQTQ